MATSGGAEGNPGRRTNTLAAHVLDFSHVRDPALRLMLVRCADRGKVEGSSETCSNLNKRISRGTQSSTSVLLHLCLSSSALSFHFCSGCLWWKPRLEAGGRRSEGQSGRRSHNLLLSHRPAAGLLHLSLSTTFSLTLQEVRTILTLSQSEATLIVLLP